MGSTPAGSGQAEKGDEMRTKALVVAVALGSLAIATSAFAAVVDGTPGDDRLHGTANADVIRGFDGNDVVRARNGNDLVRAGRGDDTVWGDAGSDILFGGDYINRAVRNGGDCLEFNSIFS